MTNKSTIIGLTGSIGMGKTTTAAMFRDFGIPVWDADTEVHRLYETDQGAIDKIAQIHPNAITNNTVNRDELKQWIAKDSSALKQIEQIVHPLIEKSRNRFIEAHKNQTIVLDIPLLFENGLDKLVDVVVVVSTSPENQRERVLARGTMSESQFNAILAKQMPDSEKRSKADIVIETNSFDKAKAQVKTMIEQAGN